MNLVENCDYDLLRKNFAFSPFVYSLIFIIFFFFVNYTYYMSKIKLPKSFFKALINNYPIYSFLTNFFTKTLMCKLPLNLKR